MNPNPAPAELARARARVAELKRLTKREVGDIYARACLSRVHSLNLAEQRKSWMIYDIVRAEHGAEIAERTA